MSDLDPEVYGEAGDDGRPENIPEKFWRPAEGEAPASIDQGAMLTEYNYRTKQIGEADGMFGAPEDSYVVPSDYALPEGVEYELQDDDPMVAWFSEYAKAHNLSQKHFSGVVQGFIEQDAARKAAEVAQIHAELDALGPNGKGVEMVTQLKQQADNWFSELPEDTRAKYQQGLEDMLPNAGAFETLRFLVNQAQPGRLPAGDDLGDRGGVTLDEINAMQSEVYPADHAQAGQRKYAVDAKFRDRVNAMRSQVLGA